MTTFNAIRIVLVDGEYELDAINDNGEYSDSCWGGYKSIADAANDALDLIQAIAVNGDAFRPDPNRKKGLRNNPIWNGGVNV